MTTSPVTSVKYVVFTDEEADTQSNFIPNIQGANSQDVDSSHELRQMKISILEDFTRRETVASHQFRQFILSGLGQRDFLR